jgi:hypothetical protein
MYALQQGAMLRKAKVARLRQQLDQWLFQESKQVRQGGRQ